MIYYFYFLEDKYMSPSKTIYHLGSFLIILVVAILIILLPNYPSLKIDNSVEGFEWTSDSENKFLLIQDTINRNRYFDVDLIQKNQASQEEVDYFNKNGIWPWSPVTKALYIQAIRSNPYVKIAPGAALLETQSIYNETAIRMVLSQQTKEGHFLIHGIQVQGENVDELPSGFGEFAYNSGLMEDRSKDVIRCNADGNGLERVHGSLVSPVDYNDLENVIPGFTFINGPCNPCVALNEKPDYSCPFRLRLKDSPEVSNIWRLLWGI